MKNLFLILLLVSVFGAAGWYFQQEEVNSLAPGLNLPKNLPIESETASTSSETVNVIETDFKSLALKIVDRPIMITAKLNDATRKLATDKLKEVAAYIRQDYDILGPWYDLGAYRKLIGDYEGAIEAWNFIGLIRPKDYISYNNLGDLYAFELKDYEKGEQNFLKSINNDPNNINAYLQLATLYEYAYKEKFKEAENILLLGIQTNPIVANLKVALAQYYERNGRKAEAARYFEEALKLDPNNQSLQQEIARFKTLIN